ncbi:xanthine dehydrogenase/oxidase-like [Physella acuta]|uniref:xanthine dehydrogenase/oxidase-like n=1 Tax=Physella acuta TaxID=109671 RepID=UPI0027DE57F5|nr:xanthine dehydrogenase/oxidase-like [Physella acuta]
MAGSHVLIFFVNGRKITVNNPDPEMTLLHFLRYKLHLTGSKLGCGEGGCGACTVMYSRYDSTLDIIIHYAVNACLAPLCALHGISVTTIEGIGSIKTKLHPVQRMIAESHGSQCGFCTPGIIMSVYALLRNNPKPTKKQLYDALDGNLCRCTGYRPILDGLYPLTKEYAACPMGDNCCRNDDTSISSSCGTSNDDCNGFGYSTGYNTDEYYDKNKKQESLYDPTQEPIFPPELKLMSPKLIVEYLRFESDRCTWLRPTNLQQLLEIKKEHPDCILVTGNTEIGIEIKFKQRRCGILVSPAFVKELREVTILEKGIKFGASVTLTDLEKHLRKVVETLPEEKTRVFAGFIDMLGYFAGRQIRNVASLGGNVINASPISDLNPLLLACRAEIEFDALEQGSRTVKMDTDFFRGYKKTRMRPHEILVAITLPFTSENEYFFGYKQASRREDDISIVNAGMRVDLDHNGKIIKDIQLAFGGMSVNTVLATKTMEALKGRVWDESVLDTACSQDMLPADLPLPPGSPGGMVAYRRALTLSFFFKFYTAVTNRLQQKVIMNLMMPENVSASEPLHRGISYGSQFYAVKHPDSSFDTVGRPLVHVAAHKQVTGEAIYLDDIPIAEGELFLGLVTSKKAHAHLLKVDLTPALSMPGVVDVVDYRDVPQENNWDVKEQVFAKDKVVHEGQIIAAVIAKSHAEAQRAAHSVIVEYEDLESVVTIKQAIDKNLIHPTTFKLETGDVDATFSACSHVVEGDMHVSAQEHFYLEPQGCVVYPKDVGEIEVVATTQSPTQMQKCLIKVLGFSANHITVKVKRLGGGFGGKETRTTSVVLPTAVAAVKTNLPVRCILDRDEDMCLTGTRHPAYIKYKIGFNNSGKILALDAQLYLNMGHSVDLSTAVLETALLALDSAYKTQNFRAKGYLCMTNLTSCTAFRGFGAPQAIIMAENWISHVADTLEMPSEEVREKNFYKSGDSVPCGQVLSGCNLTRCWQECIKNSDFYNRKEKVEQYNRENRWKKRGITVTPLKCGLAFLLQSMNQGGALVHIYTDGTVLVAHGGIEMGQGLHTKMIQVVSKELDIPVSCIHINETSTATIPNTGPTAASMSSDLYGAALIDACRQLKERLAPYRAADPEKTIKDWAHNAHQDRVCLSAVGYYKLEGVSLDWNKKVNNPFSYFCYGAACAEVEIDCLTGDHQVLRTDIIMDVGQSLNPAIDVGQIEGAFTQGYGLMMLEEYKVSPAGIHLSRGPGNYKIPSFANIPQVMNVSLLKNSKNPRAVYSSKGIGEPPLCLATSVLMATKEAIKAARLDSGLKGYFCLNTPATPERIRLACQDKFAQMFTEDAEKDAEKPWTVVL